MIRHTKPGMIHHVSVTQESFALLLDVYVSNAELYQNDVNAKVPATSRYLSSLLGSVAGRGCHGFWWICWFILICCSETIPRSVKICWTIPICTLVDLSIDMNFAQHSIVLQLTKEHRMWWWWWCTKHLPSEVRILTIYHLRHKLYKGARTFCLSELLFYSKP